jgi:hypothetical protein
MFEAKLRGESPEDCVQLLYGCHYIGHEAGEIRILEELLLPDPFLRVERACNEFGEIGVDEVMNKLFEIVVESVWFFVCTIASEFIVLSERLGSLRCGWSLCNHFLMED